MDYPSQEALDRAYGQGQRRGFDKAIEFAIVEFKAMRDDKEMLTIGEICKILKTIEQ